MIKVLCSQFYSYQILLQKWWRTRADCCWTVLLPPVLQSDQGGEWVNSVLQELTNLLSIEHVFTTSYRPRLNGSTERVHRWLNSALGIYCEKNQQLWQEFLQPATYAHNTSPIPGTDQVTPFRFSKDRFRLCEISQLIATSPVSCFRRLVKQFIIAYRKLETFLIDMANLKDSSVSVPTYLYKVDHMEAPTSLV